MNDSRQDKKENEKLSERDKNILMSRNYDINFGDMQYDGEDLMIEAGLRSEK